VHRLALDRHGVIRLALGLVVVEIGRRRGGRQEFVRQRRDDVGDVFQLAFVGPLASDAEVIRRAEANVRRRAGINRTDRFGVAVLGAIQREIDLDSRVLRFVLLDDFVERVILGLVEAFGEPYGDFFLGQSWGFLLCFATCACGNAPHCHRQ